MGNDIKQDDCKRWDILFFRKDPEKENIMRVYAVVIKTIITAKPLEKPYFIMIYEKMSSVNRSTLSEVREYLEEAGINLGSCCFYDVKGMKNKTTLVFPFEIDFEQIPTMIFSGAEWIQEDIKGEWTKIQNPFEIQNPTLWQKNIVFFKPSHDGSEANARAIIIETRLRGVRTEDDIKTPYLTVIYADPVFSNLFTDFSKVRETFSDNGIDFSDWKFYKLNGVTPEFIFALPKDFEPGKVSEMKFGGIYDIPDISRFPFVETAKPFVS